MVTIWSCDMNGPNTDNAAKFDTKNLSPPSKQLQQKIKKHKVVLITNICISLVAKITFIRFLKSLCSFSPFITLCHSGHVILPVNECGLPYMNVTFLCYPLLSWELGE